jgi:hypothetical protein
MSVVVGEAECFELWMWYYVWCVSFDVYFKRLAPFCTLDDAKAI